MYSFKGDPDAKEQPDILELSPSRNAISNENRAALRMATGK
jgi:hypothetical protein